MVTPNEEMAAIYQRMIGYRTDPVGFMTNVLSLPEEYIWPKMIEVAEAVRDHQLVCVRAGHFVSKTFSMGRIVPWFKICFQPSTVVTTAPSDNLVKNQLWREIHAAFTGAKVPLGGKMTTLQWDVRPSDEVLAKLDPQQREKWEKNFAIGFSTSPDTATEHATKMQGWHNDWVLVVIDEACGIAPQIWRTATEALINDEQCKLVAIGNPTDPESEFAKACYSSDPVKNEGSEAYTSDRGYHVVTISAKDTPNYIQNRRVIPGLASREWVNRIEAKYGPDGDGTRYRVLGLFPTFKEGTYYGRYLAQARKDGRVDRYDWDSSAPVYTFSDTGDKWTATIFAQFIKQRIRIIDDYWDYEGMGLPHWANAMQSKPYIYANEHYVGPELASGTPGRFQTGKSTRNIAAGLGINMIPVEHHSFDMGIETVRGIWDLLDINEKCETVLWAAKGYGKKKNAALSTDEQEVFHDNPAKTAHRHMMDALRHLAYAYRYHIIIDGSRIGYTGAIPNIPDRQDAGTLDLLGVG